MSKEQQELLDEAYENYVKSFFKGELKKNYEGGGYDFDDYYYSIIDVQHLLGWPQDGPVSKEEFINECKTDTEFSEKWGLKIEERELSLEERFNIKYPGGRFSIFQENFPNTHRRNNPNDLLDAFDIPTKEITITYNDKTIESYE